MNECPPVEEAGGLDIAVKNCQEREQFGRPISAFQTIQFHIADMSVRLETALWLVYRAAWLKDQGESYTLAAVQVSHTPPRFSVATVCLQAAPLATQPSGVS